MTGRRRVIAATAAIVLFLALGSFGTACGVKDKIKQGGDAGGSTGY